MSSDHNMPARERKRLLAKELKTHAEKLALGNDLPLEMVKRILFAEARRRKGK